MRLHELKEGWFNKQEKRDAPTHLTSEERALIKRLFPQSNVNMKMADGSYVFDSNAHAIHKNLRLTFYKKDGELRVSVQYYRNDDGPSNPNIAPITHTDHQASEDELERIIKGAE